MHCCFSRLIACSLFVLLCHLSIPGICSAEQVESAAERWSPGGNGGTPEFQRHIVPLIGKLGCNNRACHGSFQGQNGFRLSLFGHDPQMDHDELTKDEGDGARINVENPLHSLALLKPTSEDDHEGGRRMTKDSWQYSMLYNWISAGAEFRPDHEATLQRLKIEPEELHLEIGSAGKSVPLRAIAQFSDGTVEDVTALTLFSTNDETVANVSDEGVVSAAGGGDTAIVATFGGGVVTSQVIVPVKNDIDLSADLPANNEIDRLVRDKLEKVGIRPSPLSQDEVFLRRAYLDVIGTLPTPEEARKFLDSDATDKRAQLIDQLLDRPEYAMYWATKFDDWTGNDNRFTPVPRAKSGWLWHDWLREKLQRNLPYDEIVGGFLTATTREGRSLEQVAAEYTKIRDNLREAFDDGTYAQRRTNDIFWLKATNGREETVALQVAHSFLGVRLQCAQCHKHPFDRWTQDDFRSFTSFFSVVNRGVPDDVPKEIAERKKNQDYRYLEIYVSASDRVRQQLERQPMKLLGGDVVLYQEGTDPRVALWEWMRSPDNSYFAPSIVNRIWGHYFGVGIVEPVDDFNAANPPSNPQLLDWLARDFVEHGFDLRHLHRTILNSRTYQLSWQPNETNRVDERNFSRALLRRMPAEVVLDSINQLTGGRDRYSSSNAPPDVRTIDLALTRLRGGGPEYVLGIFGRPLRTQTCDCERGTETGLAQALYLLNDEDVNRKISDPDGRLAKRLTEVPNNWQLIEELYLGALARFPRDDEMQKALAFVANAETRESGIQDVLWSLMNLREFIFIH